MTDLATADWVQIQDLIGRYNWLLDEGEAEAWAMLWQPEASFCGVLPKPIAGRPALVRIAQAVFRDNDKGMMRHHAGNLHCDYMQDAHHVRARFYNYVSVWGEAARQFTMSINEMQLVREDEGWRIARNEVRVLPVGPSPSYLRDGASSGR